MAVVDPRSDDLPHVAVAGGAGCSAVSRRRCLAGLGALVLAGCASAPAPQRRVGGGEEPASRQSAVPPTRTPLALDPGGREGAVARAMLVINTPYTYGGNTPGGGFDCSGLVHYVFSQVAEGTLAARSLPRSTAQWAAVTEPVAQGQLRRGDLVFFNTTGAPFSHMGIYVGQNQFVHAPSSGGTVRKDALSSRYFAARYMGGRRVFGE